MSQPIEETVEEAARRRYQETVEASKRLGLTSTGSLTLQELERRERAARRLRARLITHPWYAKGDARGGLDYWRRLHSSMVMTD